MKFTTAYCTDDQEPIQSYCSQSPVVLVLCPLNGLDVDALLHHLPQWAHLPQLVHMRHCLSNSSINLTISGEATNAVPAANEIRRTENSAQVKLTPGKMSQLFKLEQHGGQGDHSQGAQPSSARSSTEQLHTTAIMAI